MLWWYVKDIFLLIFISQNCKNIYWNLRKASVFQDLIAIKFHFKMDYDIHRQLKIRWGLMNTDNLDNDG